MKVGEQSFCTTIIPVTKKYPFNFAHCYVSDQCCLGVFGRFDCDNNNSYDKEIPISNLSHYYMSDQYCIPAWPLKDDHRKAKRSQVLPELSQ